MCNTATSSSPRLEVAQHLIDLIDSCKVLVLLIVTCLVPLHAALMHSESCYVFHLVATRGLTAP